MFQAHRANVFSRDIALRVSIARRSTCAGKMLSWGLFIPHFTAFRQCSDYILALRIFILVLIVARNAPGTRGWVIVFGTHHLVVEPFYYIHYRLWTEVVNLAADCLVLLEPSEVPAIHPVNSWLSCHSEGQTTFASVFNALVLSRGLFIPRFSLFRGGQTISSPFAGAGRSWRFLLV